MKVWIPKCGDAVSLLQPWAFSLCYEGRNGGLYDRIDRPAAGRRRRGDPILVTIPAGAELVFDRIYVRQNNDEFASVTFIIKDHPDDSLVGERFWAKLEDVNDIDALLMSTDNPVGGLAKAQYRALLAAQKNPEVAQKAAKAKASRDDLEAVRTEVRETVRMSAHLLRPNPLTRFIRNIVLRVSSQDRGDIHRSANESYVIDCMVSEPCRFRPEHWQVAATRSNPDGSTERDMQFVWKKNRFDPATARFGGFTVTTRDGRVVAMAMLP